MRKEVNVALLATILFLTSFGCSKKSSSDVATINEFATSVIYATSLVDDYECVIDINCKVNLPGGELAMGIKNDMKYQKEPFYADVTTYRYNTDKNPESESSRFIMEVKYGERKDYLFYNDEWYQEYNEVSDFHSAIEWVDVMANGLIFFKSCANLELVQKDDDYHGIIADRYEGTISKDLLEPLMNSTGSTQLLGVNISREYFENSSDQPISICIDKNNVIVGYKMDLSELSQGIFETVDKQNGISSENSIFRFEYHIVEAYVTSYDKGIDTTIPVEALSSPYVIIEN